MSIATEFERLILDTALQKKLAGVQDLSSHQSLYCKMLQEGLIQKRSYSLAPVNVLGTSIPGQTTYQVDLKK